MNTVRIVSKSGDLRESSPAFTFATAPFTRQLEIFQGEFFILGPPQDDREEAVRVIRREWLDSYPDAVLFKPREQFKELGRDFAGVSDCDRAVGSEDAQQFQGTSFFHADALGRVPTHAS